MTAPTTPKKKSRTPSRARRHVEVVPQIMGGTDDCESLEQPETEAHQEMRFVLTYGAYEEPVI